MSTTSAYISSTFHFMKSVIWLWDSIGTIHVTGKFSAKDNWSETLIPGKLASRLIRGWNSVNSTIGRKILSELTEYPTYPRFVVLKTINIIGTAAFCPSWAKIRLTRVRLIRGLLYLVCQFSCQKVSSKLFFYRYFFQWNIFRRNNVQKWPPPFSRKQGNQLGPYLVLCWQWVVF